MEMIVCIFFIYINLFFFIIFQIRTESDLCITFHHVYSSQTANRSVFVDTKTCTDRTRLPKAAGYQVRNKTRIMHV